MAYSLLGTWHGLILERNHPSEKFEPHITQKCDLTEKKLPYYMKFWRHFNLAILAIFQKIAKLKCTKIKCR